MKADMKGQFEYYGIKSPERRTLQKQFLPEHGLPNPFDSEVFLALWKADQREFQMFGHDLLRRQAKKVQEYDLELIEKRITTKIWWDSVDGLASWVCGPYLLKFPEKTDERVLANHILKNLGSSEFFINKAIGWAIRTYGNTNPVFVKAFVKEQGSKMHPISIREATRNL